MGDKQGNGESTMRRNDSAERVRELQLSIAASSSVFPGFRFSPTDTELISYYLKKKLRGTDCCVDIIPEVDFCRHEPWDLPGLSVIPSDNEWFFFSTRGKKYPNGSQSKRATQSGYWKATGKERDVKSGTATIGTKRTLVFHTGRAPKGERTEWIMHEYCMCDTSQETLVVCRLRRNGDFRSNEASSDRRISSAAETDHQSGTNGARIDGGFEDGNATKSCSMESKSRYRDHSDEHNDSESATDQQLVHDGSSSPYKDRGTDDDCFATDQQLVHDGSSSPYKDRGTDDDCFADIINDDIVKLDESASHSLITHPVFTGTSHTEVSPQETMSAADGLTTEHDKSSSHDDDHHQTSGCVFSVLTSNATTLSRFHPAYVVLIFLFCLILFLAWQRIPDNSWVSAWKFAESS